MTEKKAKHMESRGMSSGKINGKSKRAGKGNEGTAMSGMMTYLDHSNSSEAVYRTWLDAHIAGRRGERRRRLEAGHGHAESAFIRAIWLPAVRNLAYLHPEYEVTDFLEGRRYIDFAYLRGPIKIAFEIDGYGPHLRDMSRRQFCDQWVRQMHLINDGWIVVRIGYDDTKERPRMWQQLIQQMIGRWFASESERERGLSPVVSMEREVMRLANSLDRPLALSDVKRLLGCEYRLARRVVGALVDKGWLVSAGGGEVRATRWGRSDRSGEAQW
jgi:hypothetical protein